MIHKLLGAFCLSIGLSAFCYAADVKVAPMTPDEAAYFLQSIHRISYSYDADAMPVIAFYDENDASVKQHTVTSPTKITFESVGQAVANVNADGLLSFFPNPSKDVIYIKGLENSVRAELYNLDGQRVLSQPTSGTIDVSQLSVGFYILHVDNQVFKVLIQ